MGQRPRPAARQMVMRVLPLILALFAGCAVAPPAVPVAMPVTVQMPMYKMVYCSAPVPARPALPIAALKPESAPADTIRAYAETVVILKGAVGERDMVIAGCAAPAASDNNDAKGPANGETAQRK